MPISRFAVCLGLVACIASVVAAKAPWDAKPFLASPKEIFAAANDRPFPDDKTAEILLEEGFFLFDEQGRLTKRSRYVIRVATEEAAREWAMVEAVWSPWYERRPTLRARVIRPDGSVFELDPKTIAEAPVLHDDPTVLSDERMLRAPLPAIGAGAVVEQEVTWTESQPFFAAGAFQRYWLPGLHSVRQARVTIEAPADIPLRHVVRGVDLEPQETRGDSGGVRIVYELGDSERKPRHVEPDQSPEAVRVPYIAFSTGASWQAVASEYAKLVEPQITQQAVEALVQEVLDGDESPIEAATKLLAKTRELVRYTGLEFGQSAIVPYEPDKTLSRRYGDCKDQATLLTAMLRAAGHDACLALVNTRRLGRVVTDLPGLNAFNHVIVYMPGEEPVWIDPTSPFTEPGKLPFADQGKSALVVHPTTQALSHTPKAVTAENKFLQTIRIEVVSAANSRVKHVISKRGLWAAADRQLYSESSRAELEKMWAEVGKNMYVTGELKTLQFSDPGRLDEPFVVEVDYANANWGVMGIDAVLLSIDASEVFDEIPWYLRFAESKPKAGDSPNAYAHARQQPLHWRLPHVRENTYQIVPPAGYELRSLPENKTERFGSATYSERYKREGETLIATFRFETGDELLTPADVTKLRESIGAIVKQGEESGWTTSLAWDHTAMKALQQGDLKRAYARYRELIEHHPRELAHRDGYATALLRGGLGAEARRVATQTVADMPDSAAAHGMLGFILMHDELGRQTRLGFDLQGCIKAYERCLELDSSNQTVRWNLAIALEHDKYGNRYSPKAKLDRAMDVYREMLRAPNTPPDAASNLAFCLYFSDRLDDLAKLIEEHDTVAPSLQLAAVAVRDGVAAAKLKAEAITDGRQQELQQLLAAGTVLERGRHYQLAGELCNQVATIMAEPGRLRNASATLSRLKRIETLGLTADKPEYVVQQALDLLITYGLAPELFGPIAANEAFHSEELMFWARRFRPQRVLAQQIGSPPARRRDAVTLVHYDVTGSPDVGFRVRASNTDDPGIAFYVVPDVPETPDTTGNQAKATYKLLLSGVAYEEIGAYALGLLANNRPDAAKTWLDWAGGELDSGRWFASFSGDPFAKIWGGTKKEDQKALKVAAAVLAGRSSASRQALEILELSIETEESAFRKLQFQRALCESYVKERNHAKLLALVTPLLERHPANVTLRWNQMNAYYHLGRKEDAQAAAKAWLDDVPMDQDLPRQMLAAIANDAGKYDEAHQALLPLLDQDPLSMDYNAVAWQAVHLQPLPDRALDQARRACELSGSTSSSSLHTLATVHAERGELAEAHSALIQAVQTRELDELEPYDFYVIGRMAEQSGLPEAARRAYSAVTKGADDTHRLAQRRLKILGSEPAASP